jgi:hypothetical protein
MWVRKITTGIHVYSIVQLDVKYDTYYIFKLSYRMRF